MSEDESSPVEEEVESIDVVPVPRPKVAKANLIAGIQAEERRVYENFKKWIRDEYKAHEDAMRTCLGASNALNIKRLVERLIKDVQRGRAGQTRTTELYNCSSCRALEVGRRAQCLDCLIIESVNNECERRPELEEYVAISRNAVDDMRPLQTGVTVQGLENELSYEKDENAK